MCPVIQPFCSIFACIEHLLCPLSTEAFRPGCSTVAVHPFELPRIADLLITSLLPQVLARSTTSGDLAYLCDFRCTRTDLVSVAYWRVPAWLQCGCSKLSRAVLKLRASARPSDVQDTPRWHFCGLCAEPR